MDYPIIHNVGWFVTVYQNRNIQYEGGEGFHVNGKGIIHNEKMVCEYSGSWFFLHRSLKGGLRGTYSAQDLSVGFRV